MRLLLTSASFNADYGGPAVSVSHLGAALAARGIDVALWAPDGSAATCSVIFQGANLKRLSGRIQEIMQNASRLDIVHDSGIWLTHNHALAVHARRQGLHRIVSPRGMLEPWAIRYKRIKKSIAWLLYQKRDLLAADALHATSQEEAEHLKALGLTPTVHVIPNGMDIPDVASLENNRATADRADGRQVVLFLSRVHPKKGLNMLVSAWAQLRPPGWRLVIAGPSELGHADEIASLIHRHSLGDSIEMVGPQYGKAKAELLAISSLLVLPTYSENFGLAVAEALAHGMPALTTTGAPWKELRTQRCGWWVAPTTDAIMEGLRSALSTPIEDLKAMGARGRQLINEVYSWDRIAGQMVPIYEKILQRS